MKKYFWLVAQGGYTDELGRSTSELMVQKWNNDVFWTGNRLFYPEMIILGPLEFILNFSVRPATSVFQNFREENFFQN